MTTTLQKAQVCLPSDTTVQVTRDFKAPRKLVWQAHVDPKLVTRWMLGPPGWSMPVCEMDVRPGGKYRWRWRSDENGAEFGFFGEFNEVEAPAKLGHTEYFDPGDIGGDMPTDKPALVRNTFTEKKGITTLVAIMDFGSKEARDAAVSTGMTDGMEMGYQRLDEMFAQQHGG